MTAKELHPFDITEDRFEGREIAVQIGNERNSIHRKRLLEGGSTPPHGTYRHDHIFCRYCTIAAQAGALWARREGNGFAPGR